MLLLVLILVLVAFGLLVVALLTGNVLCAWLSVAVSVAAAVVLVVDWLQRRSALKAGAAAAGPPAMTSPEAIPLGDPDPVTEVLPVVPPLADRVEGTTAEDETRIDRPVDGQQTVIMAAVQPSGSAVRPSGAEGPTTLWGGSSSPSVTEKPREPAAVEDRSSTIDSRGRDAEATVSVDIRKARVDARKPGAPLGGAPADTAQAAASTASATAPPTPPSDSAVDGPAHDGPDAEGPTSAADASSASRADVVGDQADVVGDQTVDEQTVVPTVNTVKDAERPDSRTQAEPAPSDEASEFADSEATVSPPSADDVPAAPAVVESASAEGAADRDAPARIPVDQPTVATFGGPVSSGPAHELFDPVDRSAAATTPPPPPPPPGGVEDTAVLNAAGSAQQVDESEPPEEPLDPVAARIVVGLDDEVLVIDEQPRYHVASCRAVSAQATIPLPAREAIELGFTPCGWCTPDAVLADRSRASARP